MEYPQIASRLLMTGEPPFPNAKVYSLDRMLSAAANDLVVMSDSDIRVTPDLLAHCRGRISGISFGSCYLSVSRSGRSEFLVPSRSDWDEHRFLGRSLVARMLEGMHFAVGPTIAARRRVLQSIGGFARVKDYLAEDFVLGKFAAETGHGVILSSYVVEHHIGSSSLQQNIEHRGDGRAARAVRVPPDTLGSCSRCLCHSLFWCARSRLRGGPFFRSPCWCAPLPPIRFHFVFCTRESTGSCCRWKI